MQSDFINEITTWKFWFLRPPPPKKEGLSHIPALIRMWGKKRRASLSASPKKHLFFHFCKLGSEKSGLLPKPEVQISRWKPHVSKHKRRNNAEIQQKTICKQISTMFIVRMISDTILWCCITNFLMRRFVLYTISGWFAKWRHVPFDQFCCTK